MLAEHIVQQGENLGLIAKKYKVADWKEIYLHPDNAGFRKLRPNPNIINPGDKIVIPQVSAKKVTVKTGAGHRFVINSAAQKFKLKLLTPDKKPVRNGVVEVTLSGAKKRLSPNGQGIVEIEIKLNDASEMDLDVYERAESDSPSYSYSIQFNQLDPVDTLSGTQARLNALGFPAGPVDGQMGKKTRSGLKNFQRSQPSLSVDGEPGPKTHSMLEKEYGC